MLITKYSGVPYSIWYYFLSGIKTETLEVSVSTIDVKGSFYFHQDTCQSLVLLRRIWREFLQNKEGTYQGRKIKQCCPVRSAQGVKKYYM